MGFVRPIRIAGVVPFTTIDYPGCISAVIFCQGCPWRCHYCHNPHLQPISAEESITWADTFRFLYERRSFLDAVVFSGGEPMMQEGLSSAMRSVKNLGLKVGLHTAGILPRALKAILGLVDWVGMDIKAPFGAYEKVTGIPRSGEYAKKTAEMIQASGMDYEFRTTVHPDLLSTEDLFTIGHELSEMKAHTYILQKFRADGCNSDELKQNGSFAWDPYLIQYLKETFLHFETRG